MSDKLTVTLLDKEYQVACPAEEQDALRRAARSLDKRLRAIRDGGSVLGLERIAIMAALNLSYELQEADTMQLDSSLDNKLLNSLSAKLDRALDHFDR